MGAIETIQPDIREQMLRDQLHDALTGGDEPICRQFEEWLLDDSQDFIRQVLAIERDPDGLSYAELVSRWQTRWINFLIDEYGIESTRLMYGLEA